MTPSPDLGTLLTQIKTIHGKALADIAERKRWAAEDRARYEANLRKVSRHYAIFSFVCLLAGLAIGIALSAWTGIWRFAQ